ncbi:hypothetical protein DT603_08150 [Pseudoxanthomonas gei]|uniref:PRTRC system protein E n=1 Tax=Pseudoxanthomonas gei TaxID=1383030 RepID=A0ABX0AD46_9GAMM|nr:hypothetical protein [Pseudoxanthomonas gei]NDK38808.1 hypothetical protein [Pseudoxanthomonas gei]
MSNNTPNGGIVVTPRPGNVSVSENVSETEVLAFYPDGSQGILKVRTSNDQSPTAEAEFEAYMLTVCPESLTEGLERELQQLNAKLEDFSGYDKEGNAILRYTGRERELMVYKYGNRRHALIQAQKVRAQAERMQAEAKKTRAATSARIEQAAQAQAQKLIEQAEVDRRAKQIAARAGVSG